MLSLHLRRLTTIQSKAAATKLGSLTLRAFSNEAAPKLSPKPCPLYLQITLKGSDTEVYYPFPTFDAVPFLPELKKVLSKEGYSVPTPIQPQSWRSAKSHIDTKAKFRSYEMKRLKATCVATRGFSTTAAERFVAVTYEEDPSLGKTFATDLLTRGWPLWFAYAHQPPDTKYYHGWYPGPTNFEAFPEYSFVLKERSTGIMCATCHLLPLYSDIQLTELPDAGYDWCLSTAVQQQKRRAAGEVLPPPNMVTGHSINVVPEWRGQGMGVSDYCIKLAADLIRKRGIKNFILPVRPNGKIKHQKMDINEYFAMRDKDGRHVDYWLQLHIDAGMELLKPAPQSMTMVDTVAKWEGWLGEKLPKSGEYYFLDSKHSFLGPLVVDVENDICTYVEPNIWGVYRL